MILVAAVMAMTTMVASANAEGADAPSYTTVPVSDAVSVTVWEMSGSLVSYTFSVDVLMNGGATFSTVSQVYEKYTVTSDGTYLTVHCYRYPPFPAYGFTAGNNVVAARLNGVPDYPDGLFATFIVDYMIGDGGHEGSRFNALGPVDQLGPYADSPCTYLGDYNSEIVLGFSPEQLVICATIEVVPDEIDPAEPGKWMSAYIELPDGYDVSEIDTSTFTLNGVPVDHCNGHVGDYDEDGIADLKVRVDVSELSVSPLLVDLGYVLGIGQLDDGITFVDTDKVSLV